MTSLREQTTHAFKWSYLSFGVNILMLPLFSAILSRLLTKEEFGVLSSGMVLFVLGNIISDLGMGAALVQKPELTRDNIRAAFTSSLLLGLTMSAVGWTVAPLAGVYFKNPEVVTIFRALSLSFSLLSVAAISTNLLRRRLDFRSLVIAELAAYLIGHGVFGLGSAALGYGAMSLVISTYAQNILMLVITGLAARFPLSLTFRWAHFRDLYSFGSRSTLAGLADYLSQNVDVLLIGRFYDLATLGVYNRAFNAVCNPLMAFSRSISRVLESSMSAVQSDRARLRRAYIMGATSMATLLFPVAAGIIVCAHEIVLVLLGGKFLSAVPVVTVLALYIPFPILANISSTVVTATARMNAKVGIQIAYLSLLIAASLFAYHLGFGLLGIVGALLVIGMLRCLAYAVVVGQIIPGGLAESLRAYGVGMLGGVAVGVPLFLVVSLLRQAHAPLPILFVCELLLGGSLLLAVLLFGPKTEIQTQLHNRLRPLLALATSKRIRRTKA